MASSNTGIPPSWPSETNCTTLRDASFSSYLNSTEENFIRTLVTTTQNLNYHNTTNPRPKMVGDDEIDVFRADKYFNGEIGQESNVKNAVYQHKDMKNNSEKTVTSLSKLNLQPRTPSIHSESSWNSQSALLGPVLRNFSRSKTNMREKRSSFFSSCCCCDAKSIDIEDQDQFSNHGTRSFNNSYDRGTITRTIKTSFDTAEIIRFNKLRMDSNSDPFTFPVSDALPSNGAYKDDTESDASSDLFEIECLSCTSNSIAAHKPINGLDDYEPSEVSVDWSVVTASAADFTVGSDTEDKKSTLTSVTGSRAGPESRCSEKKGGQKSRSVGVFGGCRSQKAVKIAGDVYRSSNGQRKSTVECHRMQRFSDSYSPVTRFQQHGLNLRHSNTNSSASDLFYI